MKLDKIIILLFFSIPLSVFLHGEASAVKPPLEPLNCKQISKMIADADVIASGTVTSVRLSKTFQPPLETVTIHVAMTPERILKGNQPIEIINIEETYQQFIANAFLLQQMKKNSRDIVENPCHCWIVL